MERPWKNRSGWVRPSAARATSRLAAALIAVSVLLTGCADPEYDTSTPERTLAAMQQMVKDGRTDLLKRVIHIEPRDITFADTVTEASAIEDVIDKTGDLLGRLYRVSRKLKERYPNDMVDEANFVTTGGIGMLLGAGVEKTLSEFLKNPFAFIDDQRQRLTVIDMGDGTAALLWDGEPPFGGLGLQMVETRQGWKIDIPVDLPPINRFRPETREEWSVLANMMLAFERSLKHFEDKLDRGEFGSLADASGQAGRMLGESAVVQGLIYSMMKGKGPDESKAGG